MHAPPLLRRAGPADVAALASVAVAAWSEAYRELLPPTLLARATPAWREERFRALLGRPEADGRRVWLARAGEAVVGYAGTASGTGRGGSAGAAELTSLYVHPAHQGRGVGRALLEHALADLVARGGRAVDVWVLTSNAPARRFYERRGFRLEREAVARTLLGHALDHARYRRALGA